MEYFIGVTDNSWYKHLAELQPDEVNFWRPGGKHFGALPVGAPFLFKLHSPENFIAGGGFFVSEERLPLSLAWDAFGEKNGAPGINELRRLIRARGARSEPDPEIGCIMLNEPFFFPREQWIRVPENWKQNIVTGKRYSTDDAIGRALWQSVVELLPIAGASHDRMPWGVAEGTPLYGAEYLSRTRLGQGVFRVLVTGAYKRCCAISAERTLPVLQAAHIKPFVDSGPNRTDNGLLLRSDFHILFDRGYLTVTKDYRLEVSRRIKDQFQNGKDYYPLHGQRLIVLPDSAADRPNREFLEWHNSKVYLG